MAAKILTIISFKQYIINSMKLIVLQQYGYIS